MKRRDILLGLLAVVIWGANFTVIKIGLDGVPAFLLVALRFLLASLPVIPFVKRPAVSWKYVVAYGATVGIGQFSCLFYAIKIGMPAGITSIILQSQVFFTLLFASVILKESVKKNQVVGLILSAAGLFVIAGNAGGNQATFIPAAGIMLALLAAAFWGFSNIVVRKASKEAVSRGGNLDMLSLVVWSSLVPPLPLLALSLILDKPETVIDTFVGLTLPSILCILYLAFFSTLIGYGIWSMLLQKYPAGKVAPLSFLVPVTGLVTAQIVLHERLTAMQWAGGIIIIIGLVAANSGFAPISRLLRRIFKRTSA